MQRTMKRKFVLFLLFVFLLAVPGGLPGLEALPRTIVVPNDYSTIQGAINAASNGDTILVSAGRYYEGIIVDKSVSIVGKSSDTTTLYGTVEGLQQNNVGNPIHISADNVVIENFAIIQGDEYHGAIRASSCQNLKISNNFLGNDPNYSNYRGIGIAIENCTDFSITKNTIQGNGRIEIRSSLNGKVSENTLTSIQYSILVYSSPNIRFLNNTISQCEEGIQLVDSENAVFSGNRISSIIGSTSGISLSKSPGGVLSENEITNCTGGISISESSGCRLRNNHISERNFFSEGGNLFSVSGYTLEDFVLDIDSSNTVDAKPIYYLANLEGAKVDPSGYPNAGYLALVNCDNLIVEGFTLGNCSQGILLATTSNSKIRNNTIFNSDDGIYLAVYSTGNLIYGNKFYANSQSIRSYYCNDNMIIGNNMTDSGTVWIDRSSNFTIFGNSLGGFKLVAAENILAYHNNFMKNSYYLGEHYTSDVGYPTGGSYYVDYRGVDIKSGISQGIPGPDGIGDTAYNSLDYYPLMAPVYLFEAGIWGGKQVYVELESNSTVFDFKIDVEDHLISFGASGSAGSAGFVRAGIPKIVSEEAWGGNYEIIVNGKSCSYTTFSDAQNDYAYATYSNELFTPGQGSGVSSIPMFIWWAILLLTLGLVAVIVVAVVFRSRRSRMK